MIMMGITPTEVVGLQAEEESDVVDRKMGVGSHLGRYCWSTEPAVMTTMRTATSARRSA